MDINEGNKWKLKVCADGSELTGTTSTEVVTAPGAQQAIEVADLRLWNEHATQGTTGEVYSGSHLIDAGPCAAAYGGFNSAQNVVLKCRKGEALNIKSVENGAALKYSFKYRTTNGTIAGDVE